MGKLINQFEKLFYELKEAIDNFPESKRNNALFGDWSLKDILAHLNHWANHDLDCLKDLKLGKEPYWTPNVDEFNKDGVEKRKNLSWDEVYKEFWELGKKMIIEYNNLPKHLYSKKFWKKRRFTPEIFLKIDIDHYGKKHLPQIKRYLKEVG